MEREILTPEELKQENVLKIGLDDSKQLRKFISAIKRWAKGKEVDIPPERIKLVIELLERSIEYLTPTEQGLLLELSDNLFSSVEEIANEKSAKFGKPDLYDTLTRKLCYILKLEGKKEADDLIRAYRSLRLLQGAQCEFSD